MNACLSCSYTLRGTFVYNSGMQMVNYTGEWRFGRKSGVGLTFWRSGDR